jgi:hypothetical protein
MIIWVKIICPECVMADIPLDFGMTYLIAKKA